ncbi:MAG TPA: hypothetical protein VLB81_00590, partial [Gaiellales bacterium]|nr:hypothetical protein [Gaiellales bacterium]
MGGSVAAARSKLLGLGQERSAAGWFGDAALEAVADAGLTLADIDGIATYPGGINQPPGFASGIGVAELQDALRLELDWYAGGIESPGQ